MASWRWKVSNGSLSTLPSRPVLRFFATVTARDGRGDIFPDFNGTVRVSAISASRVTAIGEGTNTSEFPMGTFYHDSRAQVIYLANEIGAAGKINALSLNILAAPGQTMSNWTIRLKHTGVAASAAAAWETNDWTMVYQNDESIQGTGWTTFFFDQPFSYDGTNNLLVDISFDNDTYTFDGICASFTTPGNRAVSFQTDGAFGNPLRWAAASPPGALSRELPQVRFTIENFVATAPAQIGPFVNGVWTGELSVLQPGTNVVLRAQNESGRTGNSAGFAVQSAGQSYLAITRLAQEVRLRFETVAGLMYRIEASDSLTRPNWTQVGLIPGTGNEREFVDSVTTRAQRYYRVLAVP
jgi:outer membrane protein W